MEPLSCASVMAVIQLTGSIVTICGGYIHEVKDAREDIASLQQQATSLLEILKKLAELMNSHDGEKLWGSQTLADDAASCNLMLTRLMERIDPKNARKRTKAMRKLGIRALKWPLKCEELERITQSLLRYKSTFTLALQADQISYSIENSTISSRAEPKFNLEALRIAHGAKFDSYIDQHESECLPGTRTELFNEIKEWAISSNGKSIFWLNGLEGTGKSTFSRTLAKRFQQDELLGASFFFKRDEGDRGNAARLFPTITSQLLTRLPDLLPVIMRVIEDDPSISEKPLKEQFEKLVLKPLLGLDPTSHTSPILLVVIDAMDECDNDNDIRTILQLLPQVQKSTLLRLRVFVTSRPELPTRLGFRAVGTDYQDLIVHEVPESILNRDISLFLKHKLDSIRQERSIPLEWPGDVNFQTILKMSVPSFIHAATICRVFGDCYFDPIQSLTNILIHQNQEPILDATYLLVLNSVVKKYKGVMQKKVIQDIQEIIGIIILLKSPLSVNSLSELMGVSAISINTSLNLLHSVLNIPNDELPVRLFHLSFRDFLLNPETRGKSPIWVGEKETNMILTLKCLAIMYKSLKKNICCLNSYGTKRININSHLSSALQYSCRYWIHHLAHSTSPISLVDDIQAFLNEHFLHWVEVMSILGVVSEVLGGINTLQSVLQGDGGSKVSEFLVDAKRFILENSQIADIAPLQIYTSGLIFAPEMAITRRKFKKELPDLIKRGPRVEENWSSELQTLKGHSDWIWSVAFSPDGRLLASGSDDKTIKLWDATTGALKHTLEGHSGWVQSVAFSLDGQLLASGSSDKTIKLWNPATDILRTLEGHSGGIQSVVFLPNGRLLASGSTDKTIKLWDPTTGILKHTLTGHLKRVWSVAFSPDSQLLASGSDDKTIKLWDPTTSALKYTLVGHSGGVQSVAFSPDSQLLVSSSADRTIKLWDPAINALKYTMEGHSNQVWSVAFSPDCRLLASGSNDKTIKLWDTTTGVLKHTLGGNSGCVRSVAFSPDGQLLASGSTDTTIKLWDPTDKTIKLRDATTSALEHTLEGHSGMIWSVAFSLDGHLLASGSSDKTIKLWDPVTSSIKQTLEGHLDRVLSVAFSPNGRLLASGSSDKTVKLWDLTTGILNHTLEDHSGWVWLVAFSDCLLASGSTDKTIKLWDPATGVLKHTLEDHSGGVRFVAFSPDGRLLASSSTDKTIKLWDPATGALKHTINTDRIVFNIEFSNKLPHLVTNLGSFNIQSWHDGFTSNPSEPTSELSLQEGRWIARRGQREVWLPPNYEGVFATFKDGTIALGCRNGRVCIIQFSI